MRFLPGPFGVGSPLLVLLPLDWLLMVLCCHFLFENVPSDVLAVPHLLKSILIYDFVFSFILLVCMK